MSSDAFAAFRTESEGEGSEAVAAFAAFAEQRGADDLFELATIVDLAAISPEQAERLEAIALDVGLLERVDRIVCPECGELDEQPRLAREIEINGVVECRECGTEFETLVSWRLDSERLALTPAAAAQAERRRSERDAKPELTAVIVTALELERDAVLAHFSERVSERYQGTFFYLGSLEGEHVRWRVATCMSETGRSNTAVTTERAIDRYRPQVAFFVGIAGGFADEVELGEVIAATKVSNWQSGKDEGQGWIARTDESKAAYPLRQLASEVDRRADWETRIVGNDPGEHPVKLEPLISGDVLMRTDQSERYREARAANDRAVGVEMEGTGFHAAIEHNHEVMAMVIRGISDRLVDKTEAEAAGWQPKAAARAAAFAVELLNEFEPS